MTTESVSSLKMLAQNGQQGVSKATTFLVDPDLVQFEEGFNLRDQNIRLQEHIEHLYLAMKEGAFVPPIDVTVDAGTIICRDGYCRTMAAQKLKRELPELTLAARQLLGSESGHILHMLGTGAGGLPLTPLQQGRGYLRLTMLGLTSIQIAAKLGLSRVTIDKGIVLAQSPMEVQQMVSNGHVSSTTAIGAVKAGKAGIEALREAVRENRDAPTTTKAGKTKKVTAKSLRGTKAEKKISPRTPTVAIPEPDEPALPREEGFVTVTLKLGTARELCRFIDLLGTPGNDHEAFEAKHTIEMSML